MNVSNHLVGEASKVMGARFEDDENNCKVWYFGSVDFELDKRL